MKRHKNSQQTSGAVHTQSRQEFFPLNGSLSFDQAHEILRRCRSDKYLRRRDDLDQCPANIITTLRRLRLLLECESIKYRSVLLLGDDDLLSLALSTLELPGNITVV